MDKAKREFLKQHEKELKDRRVSIIIDSFHGVNWWEQTKVFPLFAVYFNSRDFPGKFAVRLFDGQQPTRLVTVNNTIEAARGTIPPLFYCVARSEKDEPHIVETWI